MKKLLTTLLLLLLIISSTLTGCNIKDETAANTNKDNITIGMSWVISEVDPTNGSNAWSLTSNGVSEYIYMLDESGNLYSRFVESLTQISELSWEGKLKSGLMFSDGSPVDSKAICDSLNTIQNKNPLSNASAGKIIFTAVDESTFKVETTRPTNVLKSILGEWTNVIFKATDDGSFVFTGPYVIDSLSPKTEVKLIPNQYFDENSKNRKPITIKAFSDLNTLKLAFESEEIDIAFPISTESKDSLVNAGKIIKSIDAGYQYFAFANLKKSPMSDKNIRKAIDLGIERQDYINALKGGKIPTGIFASYYPFAGDINLQRDVEKANSLLDEAGWKRDSNGIRTKNGEKLSLNLVTYPSRPDLTIIMQVMVSQLKELGIEATASVQDDINSVLSSGNYDIALYAQHTAPTGEPSFCLNQFFRTGESKNYTSFSDSNIDSLLDSIGKEKSQEARYKIAKDIQNHIHDELPIFFLVDPQWNMGVSSKLSDYQPYCGDYYIVNSKLGL
ncbi:MAG: ABC transporter substrate-binding protein [Filifactoraceae bacterium]